MTNSDQFRINTRLIPLSKWNEYHDYPTVSSLRHLVFFEEKNGFSKVLRRIGRRIYLDERSFFEWIENEGDSKAAPEKQENEPKNVDHLKLAAKDGLKKITKGYINDISNYSI